MKKLAKKLKAILLSEKEVKAGVYRDEATKKEITYSDSFKLIYLPFGSQETVSTKVAEASVKEVQKIISDVCYGTVVEIEFQGKQISSIQVLDNLLENYTSEDFE